MRQGQARPALLCGAPGKQQQDGCCPCFEGNVRLWRLGGNVAGSGELGEGARTRLVRRSAASGPEQKAAVGPLPRQRPPRKGGGAAGGMAAILENKAMEGLADPIVAVFASQVDARLTEWIRPAK